MSKAATYGAMEAAVEAYKRTQRTREDEIAELEGQVQDFRNFAIAQSKFIATQKRAIIAEIEKLRLYRTMTLSVTDTCARDQNVMLDKVLAVLGDS